MYVRDHPPPHFHAVYAEYEANVSIKQVTAVVWQLRPYAVPLQGEQTKNSLPCGEWPLARGVQLNVTHGQ